MTEIVTLGKLALDGRLIFSDGYRTKQAELGEPGIPILRVAEVLDGVIVPALGDYVRDEYRGSIGSKKSQVGDVIVTTKGTVGRVAQIREGMNEFVYSPQLCFFRATPDSGIDPRFLYQWFRGREFRHQALGVQSQTDMAPYINLTDLRTMRISLPDLVGQQSIADILGALDDRIESNNRIVIGARDLARTILATAALGGIRVAVVDVAEVVRGLAYTGAGLSSSGLAMVNLGNAENFGWLKRSGFKYYRGAYKERHLAPPGSLVVPSVEQTWSNEILGWPLLLPSDAGPALFSQDLFLIAFRAGEEWRRLPLWAAMYQPAQRAWLEGHVYGSTVARIPREALEGLEFYSPSQDDPAIDTSEALLERAWAAEVESESLARLRDTLLPELLSGRLRVPEGRERVEGVV